MASKRTNSEWMLIGQENVPLDRETAERVFQELGFPRLAMEAKNQEVTTLAQLVDCAGPTAATEFLASYIPAVNCLPVTAN